MTAGNGADSAPLESPLRSQPPPAMSATTSMTPTAPPPRRRSIFRNPDVLERGLGVLLWVGLLVILIAKPF